MSEMCVKCDGYKIVFIDQACWIWFEMCVKYDGYKMSNCDRDCRRKFEMCVKRDGYKTLPSDIIIIV